jgi:hypothetical protein
MLKRLGIVQRMAKNIHAVALGKKGGKAGRGAAKARTTEQMRKAANVRWKKEAKHE